MDLFSLNLSFQTFHKLRENLKRKIIEQTKKRLLTSFLTSLTYAVFSETAFSFCKNTGLPTGIVQDKKIRFRR